MYRFITIIIIQICIGNGDISGHILKIDAINFRIVNITAINQNIGSRALKPDAIISIIGIVRQIQIEVTIFDGHIIGCSIDSDPLQSAATRFTQVKIVDHHIGSRTGNVDRTTTMILLLGHGDITDRQVSRITWPKYPVVLPIILGVSPYHIGQGHTGRTTIEAEGFISRILQDKPVESCIICIAITAENITRHITSISIDRNIWSSITVDITINGYIRNAHYGQVRSNGNGLPAQAGVKSNGMRTWSSGIDIGDGLSQRTGSCIGRGSYHKGGHQGGSFLYHRHFRHTSRPQRKMLDAIKMDRVIVGINYTVVVRSPGLAIVNRRV